MSTPIRTYLAAGACLAGLATLGLTHLAADKAESEAKPERVTTEKLGGSDRLLAFVSTDKPIYRPGETVYIRTVLLDASTHRPTAGGANPFVQIQGPKGESLANIQTQLQGSVAGTSWQVPEGQAGGEYTIRVAFPYEGYAAAERKFDVRNYRAPRLKSQITFVRDGYGPGDEVAANLEVARAEGGIPSGAKVEAVALVDGVEAARTTTTVDATGHAIARFQLPAEIARGEGTLAMTIEDGGVVETASKTIPILLQTVDLSFYPEGGQLVVGLPARVYLEARTPAQKPADLVGAIIDDQGREVAAVKTAHEGRGRFEFTPLAGRSYSLKVKEPASIVRTFPLPEIAMQGAVLSADQLRYARQEAIALHVAASTAGEYRVTISKREQELAGKDIKLAAGNPAPISIDLASAADGVLVATLWTKSGTPLAERLIFREPQPGVTVEFKLSRPRYIPGDTAELEVITKDADGKPTTATVGLTITDDSVLELVEKRDQAPRLPVMVFLEPEVKELADAHVYLDPQNEQAPLACDLLLGTQGWRRFAFVKTADFIRTHGDQASRVLAFRGAGDPVYDDEVTSRRGGVLLGAAKFKADGGANKNNEFDAPLDAAKPAAAAPPAKEPAADRQLDRLADDDRRDAKEEGQAEAGARAQGETANGGRRAPADQELLELQRKAVVGDLRERRLMAKEQAAGEFAYLVIREYAHQVRANRTPGERIDFAETLYWNAGVTTDAKTGSAKIQVGLSDAVTSFRVWAEGFSAAGDIFAATTTLESVEPYYVEPKIPLAVTVGDTIQLPVNMVNSTFSALDNVMVQIQAEGFAPQMRSLAELSPNERKRILLEMPISRAPGKVELLLRSSAGIYSDQVSRPLVIEPQGFPTQIAHGGMLDAAHPFRCTITIPPSRVAGSIITKVAVHPTPLASMTAALERLIQEPSGCFEQTSSTTYPLVMAQQYFKSHQGVDPALIAKSSELLDKGYARLTGFECSEKGYEWFGENPGHPALTAFGLLEFTDMAQVRAVDPQMLARTRTWLLSLRDGKGGFKHERRALHTWLADPEVANSYIVWALVEGGEQGLEAEVAWVKQAALESQNGYVWALAANVLAAAGDPAATELADRLVQRQDKNGAVKNGIQTVVGSSGDALEIETTSLAALAWLRDKSRFANAQKAIEYLAESCQGGRYGSTQSTVLALKAIVTYDKLMSKPKAAGSLQLVVDGKLYGDPLPFDDSTRGEIALPAFAEALLPGEHQIEVRMQAGAEMPYTLTVNYHSVTPASSAACTLALSTKLSSAAVTEGDPVAIDVTVKNRAEKVAVNPIVIVGVPGGLEVRHDQLKELVKSKLIAAYEVRNRDVVLYWRALDPQQEVRLPISLIAAIPGSYSGPASRTYLYYGDEHKQWVEGVHVKIAARP